MRITLSAILASLMLLFTACGQQHDAEALVKDFMSENMKGDLRISGRHFTDIDSTILLKPQAIMQMRSHAATNAKRYHKEIKYADGKPTRKLYITRVKYYVDMTEVSDTYYIDHTLTRIVAFKEN